MNQSPLPYPADLRKSKRGLCSESIVECALIESNRLNYILYALKLDTPWTIYHLCNVHDMFAHNTDG